MRVNKVEFFEYKEQEVKPGMGVIIIKHQLTGRCHVAGTTTLKSYIKVIDRYWRNGSNINTKAFRVLMEKKPSPITIYYRHCNKWRDLMYATRDTLQERKLIINNAFIKNLK